MGTNRAAHSRAGQTRRWAGTTVAGQSGGAQRDLVGHADWCALGGPAWALPAIPDLPSQVPAMGQVGRAPASVGSPGWRFEGTGRAGFIGVFHWRHLCGGKKGGLGVGKTKRGKGTKLMAVADGAGVPIAIYVTSASPHEVTLVEPTLESGFICDAPQRLIGDKAYDSDGLDEHLAAEGIEMIAPHRRNRKQPTQDGRPLRRYLRRWKIERLFAWLQNFRRLVTRYEYHLDNFLGFVHLGCILILTRTYLWDDL